MLNTQLAQMNAQLGRFALAAERAERAAPVLERLDAIDDLLQARTFVAMAALENGRIDDAERILDTFSRYEGASLFGGGVVTGAARAEVALARGDTTLAIQLVDDLAVDLGRLRIPGIQSADGLEPWVVFGQAIALTTHARHGTAEGSRPYADAVRHKVTALLTGPAGMLDLPVLGIGFFGLGVWGLRCGTVDPAQAARLLVVADTMAYSRPVPSLAWETALAEAEERAPGAVHVWQTEYAGRTARDLVPDALGALEVAGLAGPAKKARDKPWLRQKH